MEPKIIQISTCVVQKDVNLDDNETVRIFGLGDNNKVYEWYGEGWGKCDD